MFQTVVQHCLTEMSKGRPYISQESIQRFSEIERCEVEPRSGIDTYDRQIAHIYQADVQHNSADLILLNRRSRKHLK